MVAKDLMEQKSKKAQDSRWVELGGCFPAWENRNLSRATTEKPVIVRGTLNGKGNQRTQNTSRRYIIFPLV